MEIKEIPTPTMPDWLKLYNTYDPEYYAPGKRVSAEEWNTLFLASVRQGNYNADTLELLIKTYLPETYLTQVDFNQFSNEMRTAYSTFTNNIQEDFIEHKTQVQAQYDTFTTQVQEDFTALTSEVNSLEERVVKAEDVAYSLNNVIQEANEYAQLANQTAIESNTFAQEAKDNASTALETANSAASVAASSNTTAQDALSTAQSAVTTANNAATQATQAVNTANAASLRAEDAIATANAAKTESAAAKNTAAQAETTANASNTTAESANNTASEAKRIAQNALDLVTEGQGSQVIVNGVAVDTFNADTKADLDYVDRQIAALVGAAPETLDTLEELATAFEENADVVKTLEDAIVTKVAKTDVEDFLSATSTNPVQNKTLYDPVTFAESERQKSKNLFDSENIPIRNSNLRYDKDTNSFIYTINETIESSQTSFVILKYGKLSPGTYTMSFDTTSTIGNTAPVIVAELDEYDNFKTSIATKNIIDGYVFLTFTLTEEKNIGLAWYYKAGWIQGDAAAGVKTLTNLQLEKGSVATEYQKHNGAIVHENNSALVFAESERQKSKNLLYIENTQNTTTITSYSDYVVLNGTPTSVEYPYTSSPLPTGVKFEQGKKYTFSRQLMSGTGNNNFSIGLVLQDVNGNGVLEVLIPNSQDSISFTINSNSISRYSCYINFDGTTTFVNAYYGLQIEEGSVATDYRHYNGAIVRDKQLNEQLSNYLPLSGGTMTGRISFADGNVALPETDDLQFITGIESYAAGGGMTYTHRDKFKQKLLQTNGAIIKGRAYGSGDDEGLIIEKAANGFAGLCLGSATGTRSVFYLKSDDSAIWRYNNGSSSYDISHPQKAGTIALTSDIPSGIITESTAYREFATLLPKNGTVINNGADLNSIEYLKVGNYYQSASANTSNMTNIPQKEAFMMTVYAPLSSTYDDESTNIWCYRTRCFMTLSGDRWWQFCYTSGTAGVWSYGPWHREIHGNGGEITGTLTISGSINLIV